MTVIDKILNEWSFRCHDGIVDINNPKKKAILVSLLEEQGLSEDDLKEANIITYDDIIKKALDRVNLLLPNGDIPPVKEDYKLGNNTNINGDDAKIFKALYPTAPPKKDQDIDSAGSKGTGHGELALYWLFAYQQPSKPVSGNPGRGKSDLTIDDGEGAVGVEVKAYDSKSMGLGRIGSDKENIDLLNTLFGLYSLVSSVDPSTDKDKKASALNFSKEDIIQAFKVLKDFNDNEKLKELIPNYPLIANIYNRIDNLLQKLSLSSLEDEEEAAGALMKRILLKKSLEKIGNKGYIVNVNPDGKLEYSKVDQDLIKDIDNKKILNNTSVNQGSLIVNPENLFS